MLLKRLINRLLIIFRDYYIDFKIQRRFIGDRIIVSINPELGISDWQSTTYDAIESFFFANDAVNINTRDIIVDVGCGDGKVFNYLLYRHVCNKMLGYEINAAEGLKTQIALSRFNNVEILCEDIFTDFPYKGTIFYLFNPFNKRLMSIFAEHILKMQATRPIIIYNNPLYINLFNAAIFDIQIIPLHQYKFANAKYAVIKFKPA